MVTQRFNVRVTTIKPSDIRKCPCEVPIPAHYRADGSCRCTDPDVKIMYEWGYRWDAELKYWVYPP